MLIKLPILYLSEYEAVREDIRYHFGGLSDLAYYALLHRKDLDSFLFDTRSILDCNFPDEEGKLDDSMEKFFYGFKCMSFLDRFWETHGEAYSHLLSPHILGDDFQLEASTVRSDSFLIIEATPI